MRPRTVLGQPRRYPGGRASGGRSDISELLPALFPPPPPPQKVSTKWTLYFPPSSTPSPLLRRQKRCAKNWRARSERSAVRGRTQGRPATGKMSVSFGHFPGSTAFAQGRKQRGCLHAWNDCCGALRRFPYRRIRRRGGERLHQGSHRRRDSRPFGWPWASWGSRRVRGWVWCVPLHEESQRQRLLEARPTADYPASDAAAIRDVTFVVRLTRVDTIHSRSVLSAAGCRASPPREPSSHPEM